MLHAVLGFIGVKMVLEYAAEEWAAHAMVQPIVAFLHGLWGGEHLIPTWVSLATVAAILALAVGASLLFGPREESEKPVEA